MLTEKENAKNEQYIFQHSNGCFGEVITYRKYLINEIKAHNDKNLPPNAEIQGFTSESITDERFRKFVKIAKDAGYTIYKVQEL